MWRDWLNVPRTLRTLRYFRREQLLCRARFMIEQRLGLYRASPALSEPIALDNAGLARLREHMERLARVEPPRPDLLKALRCGQFTLLNETADFSAGIDWKAAGKSRLWTFNLHYFWIARQAALENLRSPSLGDAELLKTWMKDWLAKNPVGTQPGWHPYVVSMRLMNWFRAISVFGEPDAETKQSLAEQTDYLVSHIEYDVMANHLFSNGIALAMAGGMFGSESETGRRARAVGTALVHEQLAEQILVDGGHYEGSAMYHSLLLQDLLTLQAVWGEPWPPLRNAIERMTRFLAEIVHTDGEIPLFGDAVLGEALPAAVLVPFAAEECGMPIPVRPRGNRSLRHSGMCVMPQEEHSARLIVKATHSAPDYQIGHSHCDLFSFELSMRGKRLIVDSGVESYEADFRREYCRSTRAHNTVSVRGREQMESWGAFRVGRRTRSEILEWPDAPPGGCLRARHNAFAPHVHERRIEFVDGRFWVIIDRVSGPGVAPAESYLHFHPLARVQEDDGLWLAERDGIRVFVRPFGVDSVDGVRGTKNPVQGWYCDEFGRREAADCLVLFHRAVCPFSFGYAIVLELADMPSAYELDDLVRRLAS